MRLIPVRTAKEEDLPWTKNSCYKFASDKRYPDVLIKVGGKLFLDMDAFEARAIKARDKQIRMAKKTKRPIAA